MNQNYKWGITITTKSAAYW